MEALKFLFYVFLFYLLYKFIRFLIIVLIAYRKGKKMMNQVFQDQTRPYGETNIQNEPETKSSKFKDEGDYIDFEEIK